MEPTILITGIILALAYLVYVVLILNFTNGWYRSSHISGDIDLKSYPTVSVIIPARNEEDKISNILTDLSAQNYPLSSLEILLIDDQSSDRTEEIATLFSTAHPGLNCRLIRHEGNNGAGSKKGALTTGITHASGELILTTDADCRAGPDWVLTMALYFKDPKIEMITGPVSFFNTKGIFNHFQTLEFLGMMSAGAGAVKAGMPFICNGANLAYRKNVFMELKGFEGNEKYISGDDVFLLHKIRKVKGSNAIGFADKREALVMTGPATNLFAFLRQRIRWASKSKGYRDIVSILTVLSVFISSIAQVAVFFLGFFNPMFFLLFGCLVLFKSIIDLPLMLGVTKFTGNSNMMKGYLLFQAIYPFYVTVAGMVSLRKRRRW